MSRSNRAARGLPDEVSADGLDVKAAAARSATRSVRVAADRGPQQITAAIDRTAASRVGVTLALDAARTAIDLRFAAARAREFARAANRACGIAERAAQRAAKAAGQPAAAAEQLRRDWRGKRQRRGGKREGRDENAMCH